MQLRLEGRRHFILFCVSFVTIILGVQLVAAVAWSADAAHMGPGVTIIQLSQDENSDWAVTDLQDRLSMFITDDPFFQDRVTVIQTSDPSVVESVDSRIIIYVSHGGPLGIVTGRYLTPWRKMAYIVENSQAPIHLFTACSSRNLIRHGNDDSGKQLYTVPGARPAEVTNVEITTTVMLAFGLDPERVSEYRTAQLTEAKGLIQSGESVHIMDFEQIILSEIENIDGNYSDTYTSDYKVYREAEEIIYSNTLDFSNLPNDVIYMISDYFRWYIDSQGAAVPRDLSALYISYVKNYYIESEWIPNPDPPPEPESYPEGPESVVYLDALFFSNGYWENSTPVFTGGTYSGLVEYIGDNHIYTKVVVNVTASGPTLDASGKTEVDSISLNHNVAGGIYVQKQKIDEVWQEPITGRNPKRTGGSWSDPAVKADYEHEPTWPGLPGTTTDAGGIHSTGEYIYVDSIPTGSGWHGPSFVRPLPSYFCMRDMGSISANLSLSHGNDGTRLRILSVCLYDEDMNLAMELRIADYHGYTSGTAAQKSRFEAKYYLEDGTSARLASDYMTGDVSGIVQVRFDPNQGIQADVPEKNPLLLFYWTEINTDRLIKYVAIQSYRYTSYPLNDAGIFSIQMTYAGSDYTVFNDNANDMDEFHQDPLFSTGVLDVPTGESYMTWASIDTGTGWHGPQYTHVLDRPFRLFQLSDFSVLAELIQGVNSEMGITSVALLDDNGTRIMAIEWGDESGSWTDGWFRAVFYPQNGGQYTRTLWYGEESFAVTISMWWDPATGQGSIYTKRGDAPYEYLVRSVYNASRVVKSVLIEGLRYGSNPLLEMRIHDIMVETDLTRPVPQGEQPEEADGSAQGNIACSEAITLVENLSSILDTNTTSWWTGWWPVLHMKTICNLESGESYYFETTIDILGAISIVDFELETPDDDHLNDTQLDTLAAQGINDFFKDVFPVEGVLLVIAFAAYSTIQLFLATMIVVPSPLSLVVLALLATAYGLAIWTLLLSIIDGVISGRLTPGSAIGIILLTIIPMLAVGNVFNYLLYHKVFAKYWTMRNLSWGFRGVGLILLTFYLCAIQFFLLSLTLLLLVFLLSMSIDYYDMAAT